MIPLLVTHPAVIGLYVVPVLIGLGMTAYFLPTLLGARRKVWNVGSVFAINALFGWSLIGWGIALAMALRTQTTTVVAAIPWKTQAR